MGWPPAYKPFTPNRAEVVQLNLALPVLNGNGLWKYRTLPRSRWAMAFSILFSIGLHGFVFFGLGKPAPPAKKISVDDTPVMQLVMPDLKEDETKPVESLSDDEAMEDPGITVPMLADIPTLVPINSFVQPLDFTPTFNTNLDSVSLSVVPVNIARNSAAVAKLGKIFDVSQLDRQPEPTFQLSPIFPPELKKEFPEATVKVGFIINTKGEVLSPYAISSDNRRFEEAALRAIVKWKFRPGFKGGRAVNTRTEISFYFRVTNDS
jgi:protein TonB